MAELSVPELRKRLTEEMETTAIRGLSRAVGVSHVTLYAVRDGADASTDTVRKLRDYFAAKDAPTPSAGDPSWALMLKTMRSQSQLVLDLLEKTHEAQVPVLNFLKGLESTYKTTGVMPTPVAGKDLEDRVKDAATRLAAATAPTPPSAPPVPRPDTGSKEPHTARPRGKGSSVKPSGRPP